MAEPQNYSVASSFVRVLTDYCDNQGLPSSELLQACGLSPEQLQDPDSRLRLHDYLALCALASTQLNDPSLGLHLGQQMKPAYLGTYGFALLSSNSPRDAMGKIARYSALVIDSAHHVIEEGEDACTRYWRYHISLPAAATRVPDELITTSGLSLVKLLTGRPDIAPAWVSFRADAPPDAAAYEAQYGCPVHFGAAECAICFDSRYLDIELPPVAAELRASLDAMCEKALLQLTGAREPAWLQQCRALISASLAAGPIDLPGVAGRLGMSSSALRLRLAKQATTFRGLVEAVRHELALSYLQDQSLSLIDITYLLGFSEQSAFQRAFKRRTGKTPGEYRAKPHRHGLHRQSDEP